MAIKRKAAGRRRTFRRGGKFGIFRAEGVPPYAWRYKDGKKVAHLLGSEVEKYGITAKSATPQQLLNRKMEGYYGYGDYGRLPGLAMRGVGAAAGGLLSGSFSGARQGWKAGGRVSRFTGLGDYAHNQLIEGGRGPMAVNPSGDLTGDITISHREFIGNISADTVNSFQNRSFAINPGLSGTFPFLSQIAQNFTLYQFEGLIFEFVSTSGETSTASNALGKVIMAVDYDPDAADFTNAIQMSNMDYAVSSRPSDGIRCGVETAPAQMATKMQFIRTGASSRDKIFTDIGKFQLATDGVPATGIIGELWVAYTCRLSRAQLSVTGFGTNIKYENMLFHASATAWVDPTETKNLIDGLGVNSLYTISAAKAGAYYTYGGDYLGGKFENVAGFERTQVRYTFPSKVSSGTYLVCATFQRSSGTNAYPFLSISGENAVTIVDSTVFPAGFSLRTDTMNTRIDAIEGTGASDKAITLWVISVLRTTTSGDPSFIITADTNVGSSHNGCMTLTQLNSSMLGNTVI